LSILWGLALRGSVLIQRNLGLEDN
jgi:hypothetical protein